MMVGGEGKGDELALDVFLVYNRLHIDLWKGSPGGSGARRGRGGNVEAIEPVLDITDNLLCVSLYVKHEKVQTHTRFPMMNQSLCPGTVLPVSPTAHLTVSVTV